jgi:hypothetical protein
VVNNEQVFIISQKKWNNGKVEYLPAGKAGWNNGEKYISSFQYSIIPTFQGL